MSFFSYLYAYYVACVLFVVAWIVDDACPEAIDASSKRAVKRFLYANFFVLQIIYVFAFPVTWYYVHRRESEFVVVDAIVVLFVVSTAASIYFDEPTAFDRDHKQNACPPPPSVVASSSSARRRSRSRSSPR